MGDIADALINGDMDFYTGEWLGKGRGFPRTGDRSLPWEKGASITNRKRGARFRKREFNAKQCERGVKFWLHDKGVTKEHHQVAVVRAWGRDNGVDGTVMEQCVQIQNNFLGFVAWYKQTQKPSTQC